MYALAAHCSGNGPCCGSLADGTAKLHRCGFGRPAPSDAEPVGGSAQGKCRTDLRGAAMGAMRKAGVWLGLVEDDDERVYGERGYDDRGYRYNEDFSEEDEVDEQALASTRSRVTERLAAEREARTERAQAATSTVRSITRPAAPTVSSPTRDNLALTPRVSERPATAAEEEERRYQITTLHPTTYNEART